MLSAMGENMSNFRSGVERSLPLVLLAPTPENTKQFYAELAAARFIVPTLGGRLAVIAAEEFGGGYLPAFTSLIEYEMGGTANGAATVAPYHMLKHLVVDDLSLGGIVINPFGSQLILHRAQIEEIDRMTSGMSARRIGNPRKLRVKKATDCPGKLADAVCGFMKSRPEVYRAYIASAVRDGDKAPHMMFAVDFDGRETQLFPDMAKVIKRFMRGDAEFEIIKATCDLLMLIEAAKILPVYRK